MGQGSVFIKTSIERSVRVYKVLLLGLITCWQGSSVIPENDGKHLSTNPFQGVKW